MGFGNRGNFKSTAPRGGSGGFNKGGRGGSRDGGSRGGFNKGGRGGSRDGGSRGGFNKGGRDGGFNKGGSRGGFNKGGRDGGFNKGGRGGFNKGGRDGGFNKGGRGGFNKGGRGGFNKGGRDGGFNKGGKRGLGARGGQKQLIEPFQRHPGVFISTGSRDDNLATLNMTTGESVYGEKRISVEQKGSEEKLEYREWNPMRSKLAATILHGVNDVYIKPGAKVLYLGAASGTTVSHVSDIVGKDGCVYAVEISPRSGRDLLEKSKKRSNIIPIIEDARHPERYRMMVGMVDVIFQDVAQPDQARIIALNAKYFLKPAGHYVIAIKANCVDSTASAETVFQIEKENLEKDGLIPEELVTLEPYQRDHCTIIGSFRAGGKTAGSKKNTKKAKASKEVESDSSSSSDSSDSE